MSVRRFSSASISSVQPKGSKFWNQETFPGTYESIVTAIVDSSGASSITFSNIPQNYAHLELRCLIFGSVTDENVRLRFNSDTASNYSRHSLNSNNTSTPLAYATTPETYIGIGGVGSSTQGYVTINQILDYKNTSKNKTVRSLNGTDRNGAGYVSIMSGHWRNSSDPVTTIDISPASGTFYQYSHFALYGIRGA